MPISHKRGVAAPDFNSLVAPITSGYPCDSDGHCPFKAIDDDVTDMSSSFCRYNCGLGIKAKPAYVKGDYYEV